MADLRFPEINQVGLAGRLTQDPELRMTETGKLRVTFTLASNLNYRDRQGQWQQDTTFAHVAAWDKLAEAVAHHLHRGSGVFLTGRLKSRVIETDEGNRTILEVVARNIQFLDKKKEEIDEETSTEEVTLSS